MYQGYSPPHHSTCARARAHTHMHTHTHTHTHTHNELTRGPSRLVPSEIAPVLQYGSGPSSHFLAKILGVDSLLFLCNTQFYFPLSSQLLLSPAKEAYLEFTIVAQLVAFMSTVWGDLGSVPK
jgi:hypothetical protein